MKIEKTIHYKMTFEGDDVVTLAQICKFCTAYILNKQERTVSAETIAQELGVDLPQLNAVERMLENILKG